VLILINLKLTVILNFLEKFPIYVIGITLIYRSVVTEQQPFVMPLGGNRLTFKKKKGAARKRKSMYAS